MDLGMANLSRSKVFLFKKNLFGAKHRHDCVLKYVSASSNRAEQKCKQFEIGNSILKLLQHICVRRNHSARPHATHTINSKSATITSSTIKAKEQKAFTFNGHVHQPYRTFSFKLRSK